MGNYPILPQLFVVHWFVCNFKICCRLRKFLDSVYNNGLDRKVLSGLLPFYKVISFRHLSSFNILCLAVVFRPVLCFYDAFSYIFYGYMYCCKIRILDQDLDLDIKWLLFLKFPGCLVWYGVFRPWLNLFVVGIILVNRLNHFAIRICILIIVIGMLRKL
ncbi:hypothetical protein R6Q59_021936 [Mikania micrantha]